MDKYEWICKVCGRKIWWWMRILKTWCWYQTDEGKVHRWCYNKPKGEDKPFSLKFA